MPREARHYFEGGFFHLHSRGIDKRTIFAKPADYQYCINLIRSHLPEFNLVIHHYCLMLNHLHLLIQVQDPKAPAQFMKKILQNYACYFRKTYNSNGFVFQNRYKCHLLDKADSLLRCSRYVDRNPLHHEATNDLFSYPWSSFSCYATGKPDGIIMYNPVYLAMADDPKQRQQAYTDYVLTNQPYDDLIDDVLYGE